jgi:FkbM family methyltransferase
MNWIARRHSGAFWTRMPADVGGLRYRCDLRDPLMREVCITGRYEPQETTLLQALIGPGMTFLDVGANWGYFTLAAAHLVGPSGHVLSVEADPRACRALAANIAANGLAHATLVTAAASDGEGTLSLHAYGLPGDERSNFGVALTTTMGSPGGRAFVVAARRLDAVLDEAAVERVHLLKMDIEGAEGRALQGLGRRLSAGLVDRIILELHPAHLREQGSSADAVVAQLRGYGYRAWRIDHSPRAHRRSAATRVEAATLLAPLAGGEDLGRWPHLLWARPGLEALAPVPVG